MPAAGAGESLIVAVNFSACDAEVWILFPTPGQWTEQIDGTLPALQIAQDDRWTAIKAPSNYGVVYVRE